MASKWNDPLHNLYEHIFLTDSCWLWTGSMDKDGYGIFTIKQKKLPAHRASYILHVGEIPHGLYTLHTCHNPSCVNPHHLKVGTQKDNIQDQIDIGTNVGKARLNAKITIEDLIYVQQSNKPAKELAVELNIPISSINNARRNRSKKYAC